MSHDSSKEGRDKLSRLSPEDRQRLAVLESELRALLASDKGKREVEIMNGACDLVDSGTRRFLEFARALSERFGITVAGHERYWFYQALTAEGYLRDDITYEAYMEMDPDSIVMTEEIKIVVGSVKRKGGTVAEAANSQEGEEGSETSTTRKRGRPRKS